MKSEEMKQLLTIPGSREAVAEISRKLLPNLAQNETQIRVSAAFIDPVLDTLMAGELPTVSQGSSEGGAFGEADLLALVLVPAVTSAISTIIIQLGLSAAATFWQKRTREMEVVLQAEIKNVIRSVNPNLNDREVNHLTKKVVGGVCDYLSRRQQLANTLLEEIDEGLTRADLAELRRKIGEYFNESELKGLCFDIGIDYEDFSIGTKQDKVREVLAYCLRHGRVSDLRTACRRVRPSVSW